ncbi:hypothetical protein FOCC_FOCC012218 [Frankliniella occidentalis]|nr:hypothetical protein FOCC_FOCC012218 [Frankliniella occidentalis]
MKETLVQELGVLSVVTLVQNCKKLVTYLRNAGLDKNMPHLAQEFEIAQALSDDPAKMEGIDRDRVQLLIKFWQPFKAESLKLEGEDYPTLPLACLAIGKLKKHCEKQLQIPRFDDAYEEELFDDEEDDFRRLRLKTARLLNKVAVLDVSHKIAHFLHPKYRELLLLDPGDRREVLNAVRDLVAVQETSAPVNDHDSPSPPKRSRLEEGYEEFDDEWTSGSRVSEEDNEVQRYLDAALSLPTVETLLEWWRTQASSYMA